MKALIVTHYYETHRGGIEIVAGRMANDLAASGLDVFWIATREGTGGSEPQPGLTRMPIEASTITERTLGFPFPLPGPAGVATLWRAVADADVVIVHDSLYAPCFTAFAAARWHRKPVLIVQHVGLVPYKNPLLRYAMQIANRCIARPLLTGADQVVFISEITRRHFAGLLYRSEPELIFNGVDTTVFRPADATEKASARRYLGLPEAVPVALFVGRFVEKKGLSVLAHLAHLRSEVTWAFAGWGPEDPRRWQSANCRVLDGLSGDALAALYRAADVFVLPSVGEGFPLVIQEALATGLPVVCGAETADADPAATALLDGVEIVGGDAEATARRFAETIDRVLARADTGSAAARRKLATDRYSWPKAIARYRDLLDGLAARTGRATARATHAAGSA